MPAQFKLPKTKTIYLYVSKSTLHCASHVIGIQRSSECLKQMIKFGG